MGCSGIIKNITEKEKQLAGVLYDSNDKELTAIRTNVRLLCDEYNLTKPYEKEKRQQILDQIFGKSVKVCVEPPFHMDYGLNTKIGNGTKISFGCVIVDANTVEIGDNCTIGPNVIISAGTHTTDPEPRWKQIEYAVPIKIGKNVYIGQGSIVCPGVRIGDNSFISAGSVVTRDILPNVIAAGAPAKAIKSL